MWSCDFFEKTLRRNGFRVIVGVDEVGRGALAGPVVAAAVAFDGRGNYKEFRDSKLLTPRCRERLAGRIRTEALAVGIGSVPESEIDSIDILKATHKAMRQAIVGLAIDPEAVLVDGFWLPGLDMHCVGIVGGDALSYSIAAASIVAKVRRDSFMKGLSADYPQYGFDRNKGYGTREHLQALALHGPSPVHRLTFGGVRPVEALGGQHDR